MTLLGEVLQLLRCAQIEYGRQVVMQGSILLGLVGLGLSQCLGKALKVKVALVYQ
jgi:hypothetical protein